MGWGLLGFQKALSGVPKVSSRLSPLSAAKPWKLDPRGFANRIWFPHTGCLKGGQVTVRGGWKMF